MSRIEYNEYEEHPGQWALWAANNQRSMNSRAGQASLRELRDALLAMEDKRLIRSKLGDETGVCAVGALIQLKAPELLTPDPWCDCDHKQSAHREEDGMLACVSTRWDGSGFSRCDCREYHPLIGPRESWLDDDDRTEERERTEAAALKVGMPERVAWVLMELNDEKLDTATPEERYAAVLAYVERELANPTSPATVARAYSGW